MSGDISIACPVMAKMLLHAARYPQTAVSGIILAQARSGGSDESTGTVALVDAIPLFHLHLNLTPMLEIALTQIEQRFRSQDLVIAGYYQANEHIRDNLPDFVALKIAEKIAENNNDACLIMIDNKRLCLNLQTAPINVSQYTLEGKWKNREKSSIHVEAGSLEIISQLLQRKVQHDVNDFDNHLDDLTCDWTNPQINKLLNTLAAANQD